MVAALLFLLRGATALRTGTTLALAPEASSSVECGEACSCPSRCSGNGECFAGKCKCFPGYTYYDCSLREWPRPPSLRSLISVRVPMDPSVRRRVSK